MRLRIEKAVYGGAGLARAYGKTVFVDGALPGELVDTRLRRDKGSFAEADLVEVIEPAPERVAAPCPYYGACGGCRYQHAAYPAQLVMKQRILEETLGRAGLRALPPVQVHAAEPWGYRNRIRLHVDPVTDSLGYKRKSSHALLLVDRCPIASPILEVLLSPLQQAVRNQGAGAWCSEIELFASKDGETALLRAVARHGTSNAPALKSFCEGMQARAPELRGAVLLQANSGESAAAKVLARWGEQSLLYEVGSAAYRVSTGAFFQTNRYLVDRLLDLTTGDARGRLAWDLYAGVGLFSRVLAGNFERVVAVEGAPVSCADLRANLPAGRVVEGDVLGFLRRPPREVPGWVLLDPPRAGLGKEGSRLLSQIGTPHVTYVSCDPATLARDLRIFADSGYALHELHLVDMFPQTFHMEAIAKLRRG